MVPWNKSNSTLRESQQVYSINFDEDALPGVFSAAQSLSRVLKIYNEVTRLIGVLL